LVRERIDPPIPADAQLPVILNSDTQSIRIAIVFNCGWREQGYA
jgi:hypothetical protein